MTSYQDYGGGELPTIIAKREGKWTRVEFNFSVIPAEGETPAQLRSEVVETDKPTTYANIVSAIVRSRYSADDIEAIILNGREDEMEALQQWRATAKEVARQAVEILNG